MAVIKARTRATDYFRIPANNIPSAYEIITANNNVVAALKKRPSAELGFLSVPDASNDLYRRRTIILKVEKASLTKGEVDIEDIPDLEDLHYTNLPWFGHVTLAKAGSRQFRSKHVLATAVDVVREFDGYLYSLNCDTHVERKRAAPVLVSLVSPTRADTYYKVTVNRQVTAELHAIHFSDAPAVPPSFIKEMVALGFVQDGNRFILPGRTDISSRVVCHLYGKITTPL